MLSRLSLLKSLLGAVAALSLGLPAVAADPSLTMILPRGVQRGSEVELSFRGSRLGDAREVFFYDSGIEVVKVEPAEDGKSVKVTVNVAPDCRLGEHMAQLRCDTGVSEFRTVWIGALPETAEQEPNNDFETPQPIPLGTTVTGKVTTEDVDYFIVEANEGQRINVEVEGLRLGTAFGSPFDPYIAILDQDRFELAAADDTPLVHQDGVASIVAPETGRYVVMIRDSSYRGDGNGYYRLHVGEFPRPLAVYPAGGPAGEETEVTLIGDPAGPFTQKVTPPEDPAAKFEFIPEQDGKIAPSKNPFRVSPFGNVLEVEPNNNAANATPGPEAPIAFNGVLSEEDDIDYFRFKATKGQKLRIECYARRLRTPVDPVMAVMDAKGKSLESADDSGGPDPAIDFTVPEDGEYLISVRDHLQQGGPEYVYRVEITPQVATMNLSIPRVQLYRQTRQQIVVPRGGRFGTLVNATRRNFSGEVILEPDQLPEGVELIAEPMNSSLASMPVLFEAAADAPLGGFLVDLKGYKADDRNISGRFSNTADLVRYRNQEMLWTADVDRLPVAVVERLPYSIEIVEPKVPLVRDGSMNLKIVAKRDEEFTKPIKVEFPFRPPGVGTLPSVEIPEGKSEVVYPLNANDKASIATWKVFAVGLADVGGTAVNSSQLATLEVADNFLMMSAERAAVVQGESTEVFAEVEQKTPFEGKAKAELLGLPNNVTAEPVEITKESTEIRFQVETASDSPVGRHTGPFVQITITQDGEPIVHRAASVELRIDAPPPEPKEEPEKKAEPDKPKEKKEKPLSRLEQLRLEAKERLEQGT